MIDSKDCRWRLGDDGRTIYAFFTYKDDAGQEKDHAWLIGLMDTPDLSQAVVDEHNSFIDAVEEDRNAAQA